MKDYLLVDGYNVIYSWPELEKLSNSNLEHARFKLIEILCNHAALTGQKIKVVFDAHQVKNSTGSHERVSGIDVLYTQQGETADALIERISGELTRKGTVYVVTSDWEEQRTIFGRGAYRMTPKELWSQVCKARKDIQYPYSKTVPTEGYLENRLVGDIRAVLERWRRKKD
ncbi:NYN domain-containing protein [Desulfolucanica intricata]|uniref:NYN domain-containing protein n=1 Tax=Desulfolucanica intricata TaxID=1285191 RepID=UPI00083664FA|nr:NYN domain-containing protein [Desulfolucanica intricata]